MARTIVERERAAAEVAERLANQETAPSWRDAEPLHRIADAFRRSVTADAELAEAVKAARADGHSWAATAVWCPCPSTAPTGSTRPTPVALKGCWTRRPGCLVRRGASSTSASRRFTKHLHRDLDNGTWDRRYGFLRTQPNFDGALVLVVSER